MEKFEYTIDVKGRLTMPAKLREELSEQFVITVGMDGCLFVYPDDEWDEFVCKLKELPSTPQARKLQRYFMSLASYTEIDKQGRFLIPSQLRQMVGLEKEAVILGNIGKIEIWSKQKWDEVNNFDDMTEIADSMVEFGLSF